MPDDRLLEHLRHAQQNLTKANGHASSLESGEFPDREALGLIRSNMAIAHGLIVIASLLGNNRA